MAADGFQANAGVNGTLSELDGAITTLRTQASTFGSNLSVVEVRQDFTKELINVLETGAAGLTLADTNEEGANLLSLQTSSSCRPCPCHWRHRPIRTCSAVLIERPQK